jgi:hypothetical protein
MSGTSAPERCGRVGGPSAAQKEGEPASGPNVDFRTGTSTLGSGEFEVELASVPPGDGGVGGQVRSAEDG